ncbi:MAG: histidine kinase dimerization/phospho-acceptor domain-containing protein, partial [Verrucomicrobiota bacterium]
MKPNGLKTIKSRILITWLGTSLFLGTIWALFSPMADRATRSYIQQRLFLEAELTVCQNLAPEQWQARYAGREDDAPLLWFEQDRSRTVFQSPAWPASLSREAVELEAFYRQEESLSSSGLPPDSGWGSARPTRLLELEVDREGWHVVVAGFENRALVLAARDRDLFGEAWKVTRALMAASIGLLLFMIVSAYAVNRRAMEPIFAITEATREIGGASLDARIPVGESFRELDDLTRMINKMLDRLERSFHQTRRFTADVSHELKTPLSILYGRVDLALQETGDDEARKLYAELLGDLDRLIDIVEKLLILSRADAGELKIERVPVDLSRLVECLEDDIKMLDDKVT